MRGSLKIAKFFGIPVLLHWSFAAVPAVVVYTWLSGETSVDNLAWLSLFAVALFGCILLHEYGHALTARRYGVETKDIVLLPIGGLARLSRLPERPLQELIVAIAGPLVNFTIALLLLPYLVIVTMPKLQEHNLPGPDTLVGDFFMFMPLLFALNIGLGVFNLIPAFPMDGGRIFRALLSMKFGRLRATQAAVIVGNIIAAAMVVGGYFYDRPSYALIGVFIYFTASREYKWVKTESMLEDHSAGDACVRNLQHVLLTDPIEMVNGPNGTPALVFDDLGEFKGVLEVQLPASGKRTYVADIYQPLASSIEAKASLKTANEMFNNGNGKALVVRENEAVVGILEPWMIWDFLSARKSQ